MSGELDVYKRQVCMHRHVASVVRWGLRQKNRPLAGYVPLDDPLSQTALADGSLSSAEDPEQLHIEREEQKAVSYTHLYRNHP